MDYRSDRVLFSGKEYVKGTMMAKIKTFSASNEQHQVPGMLGHAIVKTLLKVSFLIAA